MRLFVQPRTPADPKRKQSNELVTNWTNEWDGKPRLEYRPKRPIDQAALKRGNPCPVSWLKSSWDARRLAVSIEKWVRSATIDSPQRPTQTPEADDLATVSVSGQPRPAEASGGQRRPAEASGGKRRWRRCRFRVGRQQRNKAQKFNRRLTITAGGLSYANSNLMITRKLMNLRQLNMKLRWSGAVSGIWRLNKRTRCSFHAISMLTEWRTMSPPRFHQTLNQRDSNKRAKT